MVQALCFLPQHPATNAWKYGAFMCMAKAQSWPMSSETNHFKSRGYLNLSLCNNTVKSSNTTVFLYLSDHYREKQPGHCYHYLGNPDPSFKGCEQCVDNEQFLLHGAVTQEVRNSPPTSSNYCCQDIDTGGFPRVTCAKLQPNTPALRERNAFPPGLQLNQESRNPCNTGSQEAPKMTV